MNTPTPTARTTPAAVVDALAANERLRDSRAFLLDVRGFDEFAAGHAEGAACIPLPDLERRAADIPTDRPVLVMCQSGGRSALAAARLRALGMDDVTDVRGGFNAWREAGLPTARQTSAIPLERQVRIAAGADRGRRARPRLLPGGLPRQCPLLLRRGSDRLPADSDRHPRHLPHDVRAETPALEPRRRPRALNRRTTWPRTLPRGSLKPTGLRRRPRAR